MAQYWNIARMLLDRRVTAVPRRVLGELKRMDQPASRRGRIAPPSACCRPQSVRFVLRWLYGEHTPAMRTMVSTSFLPRFRARPSTACSKTSFPAAASVGLAFLAVTAACPTLLAGQFQTPRGWRLSSGEGNTLISDTRAWAPATSASPASSQHPARPANWWLGCGRRRCHHPLQFPARR
jgi:hypothetical protein